MPTKTTSGSNEKLMGALSYFAGPVTGIIFLLMEKDNTFVRFHAMQSTLIFGALWLLSIILGVIPVIGWIVGVIISPILTIGGLILWIVLMFKAYQGEKFKVPYFGDLAEKQLSKLGK